MRRKLSPKIWILLIAIGILLLVPTTAFAIYAARSSTANLCSKPADASGTIDSLDSGSGSGLVKLYDPVQTVLPPGMSRVSLVVRLDASTRIYRQQGTACQALQRVAFSALKAGQKLNVWSRSGIIVTTYPGQLTDPSDIVIVG